LTSDQVKEKSIMSDNYENLRIFVTKPIPASCKQLMGPFFFFLHFSEFLSVRSFVEVVDTGLGIVFGT